MHWNREPSSCWRDGVRLRNDCDDDHLHGHSAYWHVRFLPSGDGRGSLHSDDSGNARLRRKRSIDDRDDDGSAETYGRNDSGFNRSVNLGLYNGLGTFSQKEGFKTICQMEPMPAF